MIDQYLANLSQQGARPNTVKSYRHALLHFARWFEQTYGESLDPAAVIPRDLHDWLAYQQSVQAASSYTINQRISALRRFFDWCILQERARVNPVVIKARRIDKRRPQALSAIDERRLVRQVHKAGDLRDIAIVELMLEAGLRVSELPPLRLSDLTIQPRSGSVRIRRSKGGEGRTVPLTSPVRNALTDYLASPTRYAALQKYLARLGQKERPKAELDPPVFFGQRGPLKGPKAIEELLKKYALRANLPDVSPHQLRHTFATRYLEKNPGNLRYLAAILGHASTDTTMIYTEPTTETLADSMERPNP